jgi:hypothetical protein
MSSKRKVLSKKCRDLSKGLQVGPDEPPYGPRPHGQRLLSPAAELVVIAYTVGARTGSEVEGAKHGGAEEVKIISTRIYEWQNVESSA